MEKQKILDDLYKVFDKESILLDEPLKKHTTYKIGGPGDFFVKPNSAEQISYAIQVAKKNKIDYFLLGKGSNLLVSDKGYRGMVIYLSNTFSEAHFEEDVLVANAGASTIYMSHFAYENSMSGFEFACGIPGTVGGAVCMNAGAYGTETSDILIDATVIDEEGKLKVIKKEDLGYAHRSSIIPSKNYIVVSARFQLKKDSKEEIKKRMDEYTQKRTSTQPVDKPNAGSVFKRPEGEFPGKLIDDAGLKGYRIGGAVVSEKHANFIVNEENATAQDVLDLIAYIQDKVFEKSGIKLEPEIRFLGEK